MIWWSYHNWASKERNTYLIFFSISISNLYISVLENKIWAVAWSYLAQTHGIVMVWCLSMIASFDNESPMSTYTHTGTDAHTHTRIQCFNRMINMDWSENLIWNNASNRVKSNGWVLLTCWLAHCSNNLWWLVKSPK